MLTLPRSLEERGSFVSTEDTVPHECEADLIDRRGVLRWIGGVLVATGFSGVLAACRKLEELDGKRRQPPRYDPRTPLGLMQARGIAITQGKYTDPLASGIYVTAVNGTPVEHYFVDGYSPGVSADTFRLDQFGSWRWIEWYEGGRVVVPVKA